MIGAGMVIMPSAWPIQVPPPPDPKPMPPSPPAVEAARVVLDLLTGGDAAGHGRRGVTAGQRIAWWRAQRLVGVRVAGEHGDTPLLERGSGLLA